MVNLYIKEYFKFGEKLTFLARKNNTNDLTLTIFIYTNNLYVYFNLIQNKWSTSSSPNSTTYQHSVFLNDFEVGKFYYIVEIPSSVLPKPSILDIKISDGISEDSKFIHYGNYFVNPSLVKIYGNIYDALGNPLSDKVLSFTVANTLTYTDNSPYSSMTTSTITDSSGYFEINLNRSYDYIASVPELNFSKLVKVSNIPANTNAAELIFSSTDRLC
jgi:hypothetical protein